MTLAPPSSTVSLKSACASVGKIHQRIAGDAAFLLRTAGQMMHSAERQHLRTVFTRRDMTDGLAVRAHRRGFGTEMAIGIDLHFDAAIREDSLGDDRDHIDA